MSATVTSEATLSSRLALKDWEVVVEEEEEEEEEGVAGLMLFRRQASAMVYRLASGSTGVKAEFGPTGKPRGFTEHLESFDDPERGVAGPLLTRPL